MLVTSLREDEYGQTGALYNAGYGNVLVVEYAYDSMPRELQQFYGKAIGLQSGQSVYFLYAHLEEAPTLGEGDRVAHGQVLGNVGSTGNSDGDHLHLEIRIGETGGLRSGPMCTQVCYANQYYPEPIYGDWIQLEVVDPNDIFDIN